MAQTLRSKFTDAEFWVLQMLACGHTFTVARIAEVTGMSESEVPPRMEYLALLFGVDFNYNATGAIH